MSSIKKHIIFPFSLVALPAPRSSSILAVNLKHHCHSEINKHPVAVLLFYFLKNHFFRPLLTWKKTWSYRRTFACTDYLSTEISVLQIKCSVYSYTTTRQTQPRWNWASITSWSQPIHRPSWSVYKTVSSWHIQPAHTLAGSPRFLLPPLIYRSFYGNCSISWAAAMIFIITI